MSQTRLINDYETRMSVFRVRFHLIRIQIQNSRLNADPDPWFWLPKTGKNLQLKKIEYFFDQKLQFAYLSLSFYNGRPSNRRSLQPSKENIQHFKTWDFLFFFYFCVSFLPSWIRIPDPIQIRIRNTDDCLGIYLFIFVIMREDPNLRSEYSESGSWQKVYLVTEGMVG